MYHIIWKRVFYIIGIISKRVNYTKISVDRYNVFCYSIYIEGEIFLEKTKNLKINKDLVAKILTGTAIGTVAGLSLALGGGIVLLSIAVVVDARASYGAVDTSVYEESVNDISTESQDDQNANDFDIHDLVVIENASLNQARDLYIMQATEDDEILYEYHIDFCASNINRDEMQPLFNYLTEEEKEMIATNNGKVTTLELDTILTRIRSEYQKQSIQANPSLKLIDN